MRYIIPCSKVDQKHLLVMKYITNEKSFSATNEAEFKISLVIY